MVIKIPDPKILDPGFKCHICDTSMAVDKCHGKSLRLVDEKLVCHTCGKEIQIPKCCGTDMLMLQI